MPLGQTSLTYQVKVSPMGKVQYALPLEKQEYRFRVEEAGERTSLTVLDSESTPFTKEKLTGLYDVFARVMADDNLDI